MSERSIFRDGLGRFFIALADFQRFDHGGEGELVVPEDMGRTIEEMDLRVGDQVLWACGDNLEGTATVSRVEGDTCFVTQN